MQCKFCRTDTENIDLTTLQAYCDDQCRQSQRIYKTWKPLSAKLKNDETQHDEETFHDIIIRTGGYPVHCAHRGGGFEFAPENTMYAFKKAVEHGARLLELDLRLTRDYQLVLMHWSTIDETTNGRGEISDYTLEELRRFDAATNYPTLKDTGITIPTLKEFLDTFVPVKDLLFYFDFKDVLSLKMTLKFIEPYKISNRYTLGSALYRPNRFILQNRTNKSMPISTDISQSIEIIGLHKLGLLDGYAFEHDIFGFVLCGATSFVWTRALVEDVHKRGKRVAISSYGKELNKVERLREAIAYKVDFIMTDRPDLLQALLKK